MQAKTRMELYRGELTRLTSGLLLWLGVRPRQGLWCLAEFGVGTTRSLLSGFCFTGVSLARLGRALSTVLAVLLADVRVCREASGFILINRNSSCRLKMIVTLQACHRAKRLGSADHIELFVVKVKATKLFSR